MNILNSYKDLIFEFQRIWNSHIIFNQILTTFSCNYNFRVRYITLRIIINSNQYNSITLQRFLDIYKSYSSFNIFIIKYAQSFIISWIYYHAETWDVNNILIESLERHRRRFMIIIEYILEKKLYIDKSLFSMKSSNNSCENDSCSISHVIKSSMIYIKRIDHFLLHFNHLYSWDVISINTQSYFR